MLTNESWGWETDWNQGVTSSGHGWLMGLDFDSFKIKPTWHSNRWICINLSRIPWIQDNWSRWSIVLCGHSCRAIVCFVNCCALVACQCFKQPSMQFGNLLLADLWELPWNIVNLKQHTQPTHQIQKMQLRLEFELMNYKSYLKWDGSNNYVFNTW